MLTSYVSRAVCNVLGNAYPTYASYKAVLSSSPEEHKQWLTYWLAFTLFTLVETFGDAFVSWLPLYWEAKIACVVWLSVFGGATTLYNSCVKIFLEKYEDAIDAQVAQLQQAAAQSMSGVASQSMTSLRAQGTQIAATGLQWLASANTGGRS